MKKIAFGFAAAVVLGLSSYSVPANAFPVQQQAGAASGAGIVHAAFHRHPVCSVRTVVSRGPHGRRIVKKVRVCR